MLNLLIGSNLLMVGLFVLKINSLPPQIPLFYSKLIGESQLADLWMIIILPIILDLFFYLNNYIYTRFFSGNEFVKKVINYLNLFLIITITLIFVRIIFFIS